LGVALIRIAIRIALRSMTVLAVPTDPAYAHLLGRSIVNHDPRNRLFSAVNLLGTLEPQARPGAPWFTRDVYDQQGPSCTAQTAIGVCRTGSANYRLFRPFWPDYDTEFERHDLYETSKDYDPWDGNNYDGTSTDAPFRLLAKREQIAEWRWLFGVDQLWNWVHNYGPAAAGTIWTTEMFRPRTDGHITPDGEPVGGHAYRIVQAQERRSGGHTQRRFRVVNSWSRNWGQNGRCWIDYDSMGELLAQDGEVVVPTLFAA
jgi:hypothetical protein